MEIKSLFEDLEITYHEDEQLNQVESIGYKIYKNMLEELNKFITELKIPSSTEELNNLAPKIKSYSNLMGAISLSSYLDQSSGFQDTEKFKVMKESLLKIETLSSKFFMDLSIKIDDFDVANSERFLKRMKYYSKYTPKNPLTRELIAKLEETINKQSELYQTIEDGIDYSEFDGKKVTKFDYISLLHDKDKNKRTAVFKHFTNCRKEANESLFLLASAMSNSRNQIARLSGFNNSHDAECTTSLFFDEKMVYELNDLFKSYLPLKQRVAEVRRKLLGLEKLGVEDSFAPIYELRSIDYDSALELINTHLIIPITKQFPDYEKHMNFLINRMDIKTEKDPKRINGAWCGGLDNGKELSGIMFFGKYDCKVDDVRTIAHELNHGVHHFLNAKEGEINDTGTPAFMTEAMAMSAENIFISNWLKTDSLSKEEKIELLLSKLENSLSTVFGQYLVHMIELGFYDGNITDYESYKNYSKNLVDGLKNPDVESYDEIEKTQMLRNHHFDHTLYCIRYVLAELLATKLETMNYQDIAGLAEETSKQITKEEIFSVYKKYGIDLTNLDWIKDAFKTYEENINLLESLTN